MTYDFFGNLVARTAAPTNFIVGGAGSAPLVGTGNADQISGGGAGHAMSGGAGDDTYQVLSLFDSVTESSGSGVDTVVVAGTKGVDAIKWFYLPDNVEHMVLSNQITGFGNALQNIIEGGVGAQVIVGGGGNDVLSGGIGADVFHFSAGSGYDVILDFNSAEGDVVRLRDYSFITFADVQAAMTQDGADTILQLSASDAIRFSNKTIGSFVAKDFSLPINTSTMHLTFADEFDSLNLDPTTGWDTSFPFGDATGPDSLLAHTHNNEMQIYVDPTYAGSGTDPLGINPFSVDSGVLSITLNKTPVADKPDLWNYNYTSGMISSAGTFYQQYGYFEMRAKLPAADGMWSAFWLLPKDQSPTLELDAFENIGDNRTYATEHHINSAGTKVVTNQGHVVDDITQFHTYGLLWTAAELDWYVDGVVVFTQPTSPDLNRPMYIIANLALGGTFSGPPDPGLQTATMQIDYIHAYDVDPYATRLTINDGVTPPAYDTYTGDDNDNVLEGSSGPDLIQGLGGADSIDGGLGDDILDGGNGADTVRYVYATSGVKVSLAIAGPQNTAGAGTDTLLNFENLVGSDKSDFLTGSDGDNFIDGRKGDDVVEGGLGKDNLRGGFGIDTASYAHAGSAVTVSLAIITNQDTLGAGIDKLAEFENLQGSDFNDTLTGNTGNNALEGGQGDDLLNGGDGSDTASYAGAGAGVTVDLSILTAQNTVSAGSDTLVSIENLLGSAFNDTLTGDGGANTLNGGLGDDLLTGGAGDDTFIGGGGSDTVLGGDGVDTLVLRGAKAEYLVALTATGYRLTDMRAGSPDGQVTIQDVEKVAFSDTLADSTGLIVPGVTITGTAGNDVISATKTVAGQPFPTAQADIIYGMAGNDTLDGAVGADLLVGGQGNDTYVVDNIADQTIELSGEGTDTVKAGVTFTLAANVENLTLTGVGATTGTGNGLDNKLVGNGAANTLYGLGGKDTLDGGAGADQLYGGAGDDIYVVDNVGDQVFEVAGEGKDTVKASVTFTLSADVETLTLTGAAAIDGTGNGSDNTLTGNAAANTLYGLGGVDKLDGGVGADTMFGGDGNDTYVVDNLGDQVFENANEGNDTVQSSVTFTLGDNIEALTLTGVDAIDGTGNGLANKITGNGAANILSGAGGVDTLSGGLGDDTLIGGAGKDKLTGGDGADTFVFGPALAADVDSITDFAHGVDHLAFHTADYGLAVGALDAGNLVFGTAATDSHAEFVYDAAHKTLLWDADGVGGVAAVQVATFTTAVTLSAADFMILA